FGSIIGSFLNVCIYRIPRSESIVSPGSRCAHCKKPIPWYYNIPFFSYILLKGKCRSCGKKISFRYFIVEFISALIFLVLFTHFGFTAKFWIYSLLTFSLIVATFIDLEFQIIPDRISIGGLVLGIVLSALLPQLHNVSTWKAGLINSGLGILVGGGVILFIKILGNSALYILRRLGIKLRRNSKWRKTLAKYRHIKDSMGDGDIKLMAMLGAFLGWKMAILIFFLAPFFGTPAGLYIKFKKKENVIPYGPFISVASLVAIIWGERILSYLFF
ncbi:prepilin peptidase, partial [Candidatus Omnitrophota bacterium]